MIKFQITIDSTILLRPVEILAAAPYGFTRGGKKPLSTLLALHCAMKGGEFFFTSLDATRLVEDNDIAIIAPSLGNNYFTNTPANMQRDFLRFELLPAMRSFLPLSPLQSHNAMLGVSMGAFGAMCLALQSPEVFGACALISGVYDLRMAEDERLRGDRRLLALNMACSGMIQANLYDMGQLRREADMDYLLENADSRQIGRLDIYCGDKDFLCLKQSESLYARCARKGFPADLHISPGSHNESYWKSVLPEAVGRLFSKKQVKLESTACNQ